MTVPLYLIVLLVRRAGRGEAMLAPIEPWVVGGAVVGVVLAGVTGLLVYGQSRTELRGESGNLGTAHFWLGIITAVIVFTVAGWRWRHARADRHTHRLELIAGGVLAVTAVLVQGYLGGRMTYHQGAGVWAGGQWARTAAGASHVRGPRLAGGVELSEFRGVHAHGLFPPSVVTDRDFAAINSYLKRLRG